MQIHISASFEVLEVDKGKRVWMIALVEDVVREISSGFEGVC